MRSYLSYITEQMNANFQTGDDEKYLTYLESATITEATKMQIATNYYLRDNLQPLIDKAMTPRGVDSVIEFTGNFIDDHSKALMAPAPIWNFTFADKETAFLYQLVGLTKEKLMTMYDEVVAQTYSGDNVEKNSIIMNMKTVPHMLIITGILVWAIQHKNSDLKEAIKYLISFAWYPLIFRKFFPVGVNESVMIYTVEHISGKRYIKHHKTMLSYLLFHGNTCYINYEARLTDPSDSIYADFNNRVRNQLKSAINGIANEYYVNHKANASSHETGGTFDDGNLSDQPSNTSNIGAIADSTFAKFTTTGINTSISNTVAEGCGVSKTKLSSYLNKLMPLKENQLFRLIENTLILFFASEPPDDNVGSGAFLSFGLSLYRSLGSSKDQSKQLVNGILTSWANDLLEIQKDYPTRPATIIGFRKAMFYYVIFMIKEYNN